MLKFMRNKLVGIERIGPDELLVHGLLDDDIYSLEIDLKVRLSDLRIISIDGKWKRWTTPECPRAVDFLKSAMGICVKESNLYERIRRDIGKKSCRHFANLLIECCDAIKSSQNIILKEQEKNYQQQKQEQDINVKEIFSDCLHKDGMLIDLHVHTYPASSCASDSLEDQIKEAKNIGLNAICLTDHNYIWDKDIVESIKDKLDFLILRGTEITTDQGDILVFGLEEVPNNTRGMIKLEELREEVIKRKGFMIAAHPFRGFLIFGVDQLGLTPKKASKRKLFQFIDAIEVLNGRVNNNENIFTHKVANICKLPETGGSDAHESKEVGIYATYFKEKIENEKELIDALKNSAYQPCILKGIRG